MQNIVLSGGSTMYKDFDKRLQRDIKRTVDQRVKASEDLSGSAMKAKPIEVNVISHKKQRHAVWFGGSLLASTVREHFQMGLSWNASCLTRTNIMFTARVLQLLPY